MRKGGIVVESGGVCRLLWGSASTFFQKEEKNKSEKSECGNMLGLERFDRPFRKIIHFFGEVSETNVVSGGRAPGTQQAAEMQSSGSPVLMPNA